MRNFPVSAPSGAEANHTPETVRNKGKGKGKGKAREELKSKTKFAGANTRLRTKQIREAKVFEWGMKKLLESSRKLTDDSDLDDENETYQPLTGDFSSQDLIRNKVADPPTFEPAPQDSFTDEIVVVSLENEVLKSEPGSVNSRWNFSINPLSYFQRPEIPANSSEAPKIELGNENPVTGQDAGPIPSPQMTSTPTE